MKECSMCVAFEYCNSGDLLTGYCSWKEEFRRYNDEGCIEHTTEMQKQLLINSKCWVE